MEGDFGGKQNTCCDMWSKHSLHYSMRLLLTVILLMPNSLTKVKAQFPNSLSNLRCYRSTNFTGPCLPLTSRLCLGTILPFTHSSPALASDSQTLDDAYEKLKLWSGLQNVPQCWAVVQPFLCSVYLPRCNDTQGLELPSKEVCERTRKPCQIVQEINKGWPDFLQCNHPNFISGCGQETYDKLTFNTTGRCESPLVRTDNPASWYSGVDGCGVPCDNPLFSPEQHQEVHTFVAVFGTLCLVCTCFTVLTFIIDWRNANRYPSLILFFINACFFLGSIGWMSQFVGNARRDIVCKKDGTVRKGEPQLGSNESVSCTVIFVIVYYFMVAGVCWFVMLAFAWYLTFTALGTARDALASKTAYFHLISWCLPLVLTIVCLAISEIDGDSVSGICFVGVFNHGIRALFVLVPVGLVVVVGTFFLLRGVKTLIKIKRDAPIFIPEKTFSKIRDTIFRLGIFTAVALMFVLITFAVHVYVFANEDRWRSSFRDYMYCLANVSVTAPTSQPHSVCVIEDRPSLVAMEIHIFAFFGAGIAMSSWSWTKPSLAAWERFFRWIFHKPSNKPVKLKRHRMIAQAFEKRREINQGRVSISYCSSHDDPLGMKFDLNSGSDDELSSNFAMAMPKLVCRRGGLIYPMAMNRRYSDSDITSVISTRRVSLESQLMEFREQQFYFINDLPMEAGRRGKRKMKKKRGRLNRMRPVVGPVVSGFRFGSGRFRKPRKESDSSALSQMSNAHSLRVSVEKNSIETTSLASNICPAEVVLPALTKKGRKEVTARRPPSRVVPVLDFSPNKKATDFSIFSAKSSSSVHSGVTASTAGADVEHIAGREESIHNLTLEPNAGRDESVHNLTGVTEALAVQGTAQDPQEKQHQGHKQHEKQHQKHQFHNQPVSACRQRQKSVTSKTKQRTKKITVEACVEDGVAPLHALMADISGGNWGVLLGKSGSSSSSESAAGRYSGPKELRSPLFDGYDPHQMNIFDVYDPHQMNIPYWPQVGIYDSHVRDHNRRQDPHYSYLAGMGGFSGYMDGANSYRGESSGYMNGANHYRGESSHYVNGANPYMGAPDPHMRVSSLKMGKARPVVKDQWGHFPFYASQQQNKSNYHEKNYDRRFERERKREREMRKTNQTFLNSAYPFNDDDIESMSA